MNRLLKDLKYGFRALQQRPAFALIAIVTLALGIGANTAIFSVVNGVLLRQLPYQDPDRLVMLWEASESNKNVHASYLNFVDWREQGQSFEAMSACTGRWGGRSTVTGGSEPERAYVVGVFRDFFPLVGVAPVVGRTFSPEEQTLGTPPVVVVSHSFWQRRLGGDADLSGKTLTIDGTSFSVVGVMPPGFSFPADTDLWYSHEQIARDTSERSSHNYMVVARLRPGVTIEQAQSEMSAIAARLEQQYPASNQGAGVTVVSLKDQLTGSIRPALIVLLIAVGFVLLIACANVANLMLARALARQREIAIRVALGASRSQIIRQLLTESLLLAAAGGALGLLLAFWLVRALVAMSPGTIPRVGEISVNAEVMLYTAGLSLATSVLFGLVPALKTSRPDLTASLKEGGRGTSAGAGTVRNLLVVAQVALTLVLLIGAGLLVKSFWRLSKVDAGFDSGNVLTMQLSLPSSDYGKERERIAFYRQLFARLEPLVGVQSAGMINNLPMGGVNINGQFLIEGRPKEDAGYAGFRIVSPGYFRVMNIALVKGRLFTEQDDETSTPVALLSESAATAAFRGEDPVGRRVRTGMDNRGDVWTTIIGVVRDVRHLGLERSASADLYVPYTQRPGRTRDMTVVTRATADPTSIIAAVRGQVQALDKNLPISFEPMEQVSSRSVANRRYNMILVGVFAGLAVLLALVGIYGVMSYTVAEHTREIGIRMALGAQASDVLRLIVGRGLMLTLLGIGAGLAGAFGLTRLMTSMLYDVTASDPATFAAVSALFIAVALVACFVPARRATKVDPMVALRYE